jgi:hypothetical protein
MALGSAGGHDRADRAGRRCHARGTVRRSFRRHAVLGGRHGAALVDTPEVFDPATGAFTSVPVVGAVSLSKQRRS